MLFRKRLEELYYWCHRLVAGEQIKVHFKPEQGQASRLIACALRSRSCCCEFPRNSSPISSSALDCEKLNKWLLATSEDRHILAMVACQFPLCWAPKCWQLGVKTIPFPLF